MVSQSLLEELKNVIYEDYGVKLTPQTLSSLGNDLVQFFEILMSVEFVSESKEENHD